MKKQIFLISVLLVSLLFGISSCSEEKNTNDPQTPQGSITFSINIPQGDPVTYARIHDEDEWGIESLWLYQFNADGSKLLEAPVNIKNNGLSGTGPDYSYTKNFDKLTTSTLQFIFVANEQVPSGITVGSSLNDLREKLARNTLASNGSSSDLLNTLDSKKRIPMTGQALQAGSYLIATSGNTDAVSVNLTRIVARIDVSNKIPNLVITDLKLVKTNSKSFLLPAMQNNKPSYEIPSSSTKVNNISTFKAINETKPNGGGFIFNENLEKAFYLYEGEQPSKTGAVSVQVKGTLGGNPFFYTIPFWKDGKAVTVKRNHIYRIVLGDGTPEKPGSKIKFTIEDTPWNHILVNENFDIISAKYIGTGEVSYDEDTQTLTVDEQSHNNTLRFDFDTKFSAHTGFEAEASESWITAEFYGNTLNIDTSAYSSEGQRSGTVTVKSSADQDTKYVITVVQRKS